MPIDLPTLALAGGVGLVVGWLAHLISGAEGGMLRSVVVGTLGAIAGNYFFAPLQKRLFIDDPIVATMLLAAIGSVIVLTTVRLIHRS